MNKELFYKYDFYVLEQKFPELNFIELLETNISLNKSVEPFIRNVTDLLYTSIKQSKNIEVAGIILPNIEEDLKRFLENEPHYISYKSYLESEQNLSEFVFNKFLRRIFKKDGYNDESHVIQNYVHSWLEKKLALNIVQDLRFSSLDVLKSLLEKTEILHSFYVDLVENFPKKWVLNKRKEWVDINVSPEHILDSIRMYRREYLDSYTNLLQTQSKDNLWEYVQETTRNSEYTMLNHEYSFISSVLIRTDISLWIEFWDNLKFPIIQDCVFNSSFNFKPQLYLQLLSNLIDDRTVVKSELKVLLFIVVQNYFEASNKLTEQFSNYENSEIKNERNELIFQLGIEQQKEWLEEKKRNYENIIQSLTKKLTSSEIEDWIFSYRPRINHQQFKPNEIYNSEIKLLTETYKEKAIEFLSSDLHSFNLQKFNFYIEVIRDKEDKKFTSALLEAITGHISSDKFFWDRTYTEPYWSALKGIGFIISQLDNPIQTAKELINKFKTIHQGWKPSKVDFSSLVKESFICSGIALLFENESAFKDKNEKQLFFKELVNHILTQDRFSHIDNSEYYQMPLHLLFLVANQIFTDVKEYYEQEVIDNFDNLYSLLTILSSDKNPISEKSKSLLKTRLDRELLLEKGQYGNRNQKDKVQELEKMIETLKL
ncbi:MAG: hypothetical protein CVU11_07550 [Bacteroidetes bacterium HGW-Bacteroidetes-6]|jgi:hypothetical protein|nr:MAG: hypothetical protein CVU11_07550 [Bacteroidetes bacterium HGW-Bacteroidetes-6]